MSHVAYVTLVALAAGAGFYVVIVAGLSLVTWLLLTRRRPHDPEDIKARLLERGEILPEWLERDWIDERVRTPGGYELAVHGRAGQNGRLAVVHHGVSWNWLGSLKYGQFFLEHGYSVVLLDARGHGESGGGRPSFGIFESRDLASVLAWGRSRFPSAGGTVILGVSLGAATALEYAPRDSDLAAVIADCPFSSAEAEVDHRLMRAMIPAFVRRPALRVVDALCRHVDGFSMREAAPAASCLETKAPMLFIHGLGDDYVPFAMSEAMASARRRALPEALTEILLVPGAGHAKSHRTDPAAYEAAVLAFLEQAFEIRSREPRSAR